MLIEISGPTGCGKSTLIQALYHSIHHGNKPYIFISDAITTNDSQLPEHITCTTKHNWRTDVSLAPWTLLFFIKNVRFTIYCYANAFRNEHAFKMRLAIMRSIWRKFGIFQLLHRKQFKEHLCLVDEGLIHTAHNIFVSANAPPDKSRVAWFTKHVPLPDELIIPPATETTLTKRILARCDVTPRAKTAEQKLAFVKHASKLFAQLKNAPRIQFILKQSANAYISKLAEKGYNNSFIVKEKI